MRQQKRLSLQFIDILNTNGFKCVYHNVRSLNKKLSHILSDQWYYQFDLLLFSETHTLVTDRIVIENYDHIFRSDKYLNKHTQKGVICFLRKNMKHQIIKHCWLNDRDKNYYVDLIHLNINDINIVTGYKSPDTNNAVFFNQLFKIIDNIESNEKNFNTILIGDFNFDLYTENSSFEKLLNKNNFKRALLSELPTTNFSTQIDIIFVNENMNNYVTGIYESFFSDHKPIFIGLEESNTLYNENLEIKNESENVISLYSPTKINTEHLLNQKSNKNEICNTDSRNDWKLIETNLKNLNKTFWD